MQLTFLNFNRRHNSTQKQQLNAIPNVIYTPEYNYIDYGECSRSREEQDVIYVEPQAAENAYEHIGEEQHQPQTTTHCTCDSNGYSEPAINSNRSMNPIQDYLTPIYNTVNLSDAQSSAYEPLRPRSDTNTTYSGK